MKPKFKYIRNCYIAIREVGTTLEYRILANIEEENKDKVYKLEKKGFLVQKVLLNEGNTTTDRQKEQESQDAQELNEAFGVTE